MKKSFDSRSALHICLKKWAAGKSFSAQNLQSTGSSSLKEFEGGQQRMFSSFVHKDNREYSFGKRF